ncbi:hypothetical protein ABL841_09235 [Variovorax paradoxus]|jgi:hypothetical protein|uniref:hypothetical protein n=1 Tax=Variovorax paradoxus TaxID=34073 RepID=UPI0012BD1060|nr:hypothetical protein [Variovorax paradoxus]
MSNNLIVPISRLPIDFLELQKVVEAKFSEIFGGIFLKFSRLKSRDADDLESGFVEIQGPSPGDWCLLSFAWLEQAVREDDESDLNYYVSVSTRGEKRFSAILIASLSAFGARVAYDDSHFLGEKDKLNISDLTEIKE